jgi:hypothetical protein
MALRIDQQPRPSKPTVAKDDPRYFDLRWFPTPAPEEHWTDARRAQITAIKAREKAHLGVAQSPYQAKSPARGLEALQRHLGEPDSLRMVFPQLVPARPYCADHLEGGLRIRRRDIALKKRHIQLNGPGSRVWMPHDIDRPDASVAHAKAGIPQPNVIAINPENGRGHSAIVLASPVACHSVARLEPLRFYAAVERGIARRIGADRHYTGLIAKNPLHVNWQVEWRRDVPYTLGELAKSLTQKDMRPDTAPEKTFGAGRNVIVFDELRAIAYREVREFQRNAATLDAFQVRLERVALGINMQFPDELMLNEIRGIAKSVAKWTWRHFSVETFSHRQSYLGKRANAERWANHVSAEKTKPWEAEGISRRTWYRRRARAGNECRRPAVRAAHDNLSLRSTARGR